LSRRIPAEINPAARSCLPNALRKQPPGLIQFGGGPGGPGGRGPGGLPPLGQVMPQFVQDDLKLSDDQKKQVAELQKEIDAKLDKTLTDEQKKQYKAMKENPGRGGPGGRGPGGPGGPGGGPGDGGRNPPPDRS
jgi:hypothetical protein